MKLRLVHAVLAAATLWPLVQLALVARFDASPWKLGGWGMYATPRFDTVGLEVYGHVAATGHTEQLAAASPSVRDGAHRFLESYRWLRDLAPQAPLVHAVFAEHPGWDRVQLIVMRPALDARTGMIERVRAEYVHQRPVTDTSRESGPDR